MTPDLKSAAFALGATEVRIRTDEIEVWAPAELHASVTRGLRAIDPRRTILCRLPERAWEDKQRRDNGTFA